MNQNITKQTYQAPAIEVIHVENEGIMAASNEPMPNRPWRYLADADMPDANEEPIMNNEELNV